MRAPYPRSWKDRLPGIALALAMNSALLALLVYSLTVPPPPPSQEQEIVFLLPRLPAATPRAPVVIDARPRLPTDTRTPSVTTSLPPLRGTNGITAAAPATVPPPAISGLPPRAARAPECRPDERGQIPPACPPMVKPADSNAVVLNPPTGIQDEKRWAEEKARAGSPADLGVAVGPGIGVVIKDPLCKMAWVLLGGGFECGPRNYARQTTDEQFQAALDAVNARQRARYGKPAPARGAEAEALHE